MAERRLALEDGSLVELLDRLVTAGAAVDGDAVITLAGVELIRLDLHLMLGSIGTGRGPSPLTHTATAPSPAQPHQDRKPAAGLAGLVLAVIDILRRLLECQALRRMEAGTLTPEEVERLGRSLMSLEHQTRKLATLVREATTT